MVRAAHSNCIPTPPDWTLNPALVKYGGALSSLAFDISQSISPSGLNINNAHCWQLSFKVDESAGNVYQGASSTFNLVVDATQTNNPGWTE